MPQMAPLMWNTLFIMFSSLLVFSMIKIYYSNLTNQQILKINKTTLSVQISKNLLLNWKW